MLENNPFDLEQEGFLLKMNSTRSFFLLKVEYEILKKSMLKAALKNLDL